MMRNALLLVLLIAFSQPAHSEIKNSETKTNPNVMNVESITILSSSSLAVPITQISKHYSRENNTDVNTVYDASGELVRDIKDGDPADIIISPSKTYLDEMKAEGLIDPGSIIVIASSRLNIVASKKMEVEKDEHIENTLMNIHNKALMIIGDPKLNSLGEETIDFLKKVKLWTLFEKRVILAPTSTKTVDYIIKGESAGIIYDTDLKLYGDELVDLGVVPDNLAPPVKYYAAVVVSGNMIKARNYLKYLSSKPAKAVLKARGFVVE